MDRLPRNWKTGIAVAFLSVAAVTGLKEALEPISAFGHQTPYLMFGGAVMMAAWWGGFWDGMLATLFSIVAVWYSFLPPYHSFEVTGLNGLTILPFTLEGLVISAAAEALHESRRKVLRTQEALAAERERLAVTLGSIGDGVIATDARGDVTFVNPEAARLTGWDAEQARGRPLSEVFRIVNEHTRQVVESPAEKVLRLGTVVGLANHTLLVARDGTETPIDDSGAPLRGQDGGPVEGVVLVFRDNGQKKATEEALRRSEGLYRAIGESIDYGVWVCAPDGRNIYASESFLNLVGLTQEQCSNFGWGDVLHPDDAQRTLDAWKECVRTGGQWDIEHRFRGVDGQWHSVLARGVPVRDDEGRVTCWAGINLDISERKRAEDLLRDLSQRLTYHVDHSPLAVIEWGPDMRLTRWSGEAERLFGWRAEEVLGKRMEDFRWIYDEDVPQVDGVAGELQSGTNPRRFSANRNYRKDGTVVYCEWYNSSLLDESGNLQSILSLVLDVTERRMVEEALRQARDHLEERVAERTAEIERQTVRLRELASELTQAEHRERQRLAGILHDHVQQFLVAARLHAGLLKRRSRDPDIQASAQLIDGLLEQTLDASRALTSELSPPILHERGLGPALEWLARRLRDTHTLKVEVAFDPEAEPARADVMVFLFEAVRELLLNTIKHAGVDRAEIQVDRDPEGRVRVVVSDEGAGFAPDQPRPAGATGGFGLFSIQQRLHFLGGSFDVDSAPGRGTRITLIEPPLADRDDSRPAPVAQAPAPQADAGARESRPAHGRIRVVLADDHGILRQGLAALLQSEGDLEVVGEAADGVDAVRLARQLRPDVVVMDVSMPNMSGIEATRVITTDQPGIRVVGLSLHESGDMAQAMMDAGAVAYANKGGPSDALVAAIRDAARGPETRN